MLQVLQVAIIERKQAASTGFLAIFFQLVGCYGRQWVCGGKIFYLNIFCTT
jgi:hypothetical protein